MIQITTTTDLLVAKPINEQILKCGRDAVNTQISKCVIKCFAGLGIETNNNQLQLLTEDIMDVFKFDSIEDIQICLRNGRQGKYGKTYGKLNMIIIQEWMSIHLEKKSIARESAHSTAKHDFKTKEEYNSVVKIGLDRQKEDADRIKKAKHDAAMDSAGFDEFKAQYEENKTKLSDGEGTIKPDQD